MSGKQAECYANDQIGYDLQFVDGGKTYAESAYPAKLARDKVIAALQKDPTDPEIGKLQEQAQRLEGPALTLFRGETLRGMLLTTYGFSQFGDLGQLTSIILFVLGALLVLYAGASFAMSNRRQPQARVSTASRSA